MLETNKLTKTPARGAIFSTFLKKFSRIMFSLKIYNKILTLYRKKMTKGCIPTIFQINLSFSKASPTCLEETYMFSKTLCFPKGLVENITGSYSRRNIDFVGKHPG